MTEYAVHTNDGRQIVRADDFDIVTGGVLAFYDDDGDVSRERTPTVAYSDWHVVEEV